MNGFLNYASRADELPSELQGSTRGEGRRGNEGNHRWKMEQSLSTSLKTVTWKCVVATPFKTPQECVGHRGARIREIPMDRRWARIRKTPTDRGLGRTTYSRGHVRLGN